MQLHDDFFRVNSKLRDRFRFQSATNTLYCDLSGIVIEDDDDLQAYIRDAAPILDEITNNGENRVHCIATYAKSDLAPGVSDRLEQLLSRIDRRYFLSVKRFGGKMFYRHEAWRNMQLITYDDLWREFTESEGADFLARSDLLHRLQDTFQLRLSHEQVMNVLGEQMVFNEMQFGGVMERMQGLLRSR